MSLKPLLPFGIAANIPNEFKMNTYRKDCNLIAHSPDVNEMKAKLSAQNDGESMSKFRPTTVSQES